MTDDGLLVGFDLNEEASIAVKPELTGGRWKDRQRLKKRHQRYEQKHAGPTEAPNADTNGASGPVENAVECVEPPLKKRKHDHPDNGKSRGPSAKQNPSGEVISSLFTSNPASRSTAGASDETSRKPSSLPEPSNAPLRDELAGFKALGLGQALAGHLKAKLELTAPMAIQKEAIPNLLATDSDVFLQAETGSGKTLAYLLPIVQRITGLSQEKGQDDPNNVRLHRRSGLFAIILAPTRELCKQIYKVLRRLLQCAHWIVPGYVVGGANKKGEKARLRKGMNVLVATPGRMVDHLSNTEVFDVSQVRWLVLDEGDRLMELGFRNAIQEILTKLEQRLKLLVSPMQGFPDRRVTILCSATLRRSLQRLGEMSLKDAIHVRVETSTPEVLKSFKSDETSDVSKADTLDDTDFSAPAQLRQSCIIVPAKQRLVTLAALLKQESRVTTQKEASRKAIVFISCADSVDFHFAALTRQPPVSPGSRSSPEPDAAGHEPLLPASRQTTTASARPKFPTDSTIALAPLLEPQPESGPSTTIYKLHGSLPQPVRTATLAAFSNHRAAGPAVLFTTDLAARGLDLPAIDRVIEFDPAASFSDHLHRVGRTARAGRPGEAAVFLLPGAEENYANVLEKRPTDSVKELGADEVRDLERRVERREADEILRHAFTPLAENGRSRDAWSAAATNWQLAAERWVLASSKAAELARAGFAGHVSAYATHTKSERSMFNKNALHLGHLAKAFALRERPVGFGRQSGAGGKRDVVNLGKRKKEKAGRKQRQKARSDPRLDFEGWGRFQDALDLGVASEMLSSNMYGMDPLRHTAFEFNYG